jgi:hypothetical protein
MPDHLVIPTLEDRLGGTDVVLATALGEAPPDSP